MSVSGSGSSYWSDKCSAATQTPLPQLLSNIDAFSAVAVASFAAAAVLSALVWLCWWRVHPDGRAKMWRLLGIFSALAFIGCCMGIVAWATFRMQLTHYYAASAAGTDASSTQVLVGQGNRWQAVFYVFLAAEFWFLSVAKLLVRLLLLRQCCTKRDECRLSPPHICFARRFSIA
jgi:hypothetical protein